MPLKDFPGNVKEKIGSYIPSRQPVYPVNPYVTTEHYEFGASKLSREAKIGLGMVVGGGVIFLGYELYTSFTTPQGPGCATLQTEIINVMKQQYQIIQNDIQYHGGTVPAADATKIATLQKEQASLISQYSTLVNQGVCTVPAGQALQKSIDKFLSYAGWAALSLLALGGIVLSATSINWFLKRWGGSISDANAAPTSPDEANPPSDFSTNTMPSDAGSGLSINSVENGTITQVQGSDALNAYAASDPMVAEASTIQEAYTALADETTIEELFTFFDELAVAMESIGAVDDAIAAEALVDLAELA